nr:MAG TPA: hypothetical protein [Caudoviricetes sp.]
MASGYLGGVCDLKVLIGLIFDLFVFGVLVLFNGESHPKLKKHRITLFR